MAEVKMTDRDKLVELINQGDKKCGEMRCEECEHEGTEKCGFNLIADYLLANGVIVPPCKVGDTVYVVSQGQGFCMRWNVYEGKVVDIHLNRHNKLTIRVENGEKFFGYYEPCLIFLTKEEAEAELEKRGKENG